MTSLCIFCGTSTEEGETTTVQEKGCKSINEISKLKGDNVEVSSNVKRK